MGYFDEILDITDPIAIEILSGTNEIMTYAPSVGDPIVGVPVLFDDDTEKQQPFQPQRAEFPKPRVFFKLSDIAPYDPYTDEPTITVHGQDYRIHGRPKDGQIGGTVHLRLHKIP
jgi:hypothetical protein